MLSCEFIDSRYEIWGEEIFLECEFFILTLELSDLVSLGSILVEDPDIVYPEWGNQYNSEDIRLGKRKSKILTSCLAFWEKRKMSFFGYEDVGIHKGKIKNFFHYIEFLKNKKIEAEKFFRKEFADEQMTEKIIFITKIFVVFQKFLYSDRCFDRWIRIISFYCEVIIFETK